MKEKKVTIEKLATMVQKGFSGVDDRFTEVIGKMATRDDVERLEKEVINVREHILKQYGWRISNLEAEMKLLVSFIPPLAGFVLL